MELKDLNLKDRKILYLLDLDCRKSGSQIAKSVGISKQVVDYRIKKLLKEGIITRFSTVIDTYKLGFYKYKIYLSLENANKDEISNIVDFLRKHKKTEWVTTCSGRWDIISGYLVKDLYEIDGIIKELDEKFSQYISSRETTISLGVPHWHKEYLLEKEGKNKVIYPGGKIGNLKIESIDEEIIKLLVNNARMSVVDIAQRLKTTPRIVNYHLKNLKKEGIILMSRIFFNLNKFNWNYCKALIKFKNLTEEKYNKFFAHCSSLKNLTYLINCLGPWDVELDFEIENFNEFHKIMLDIRDKFSDIIKNYDFVIGMNEIKLDYYPGACPKLE